MQKSGHRNCHHFCFKKIEHAFAKLALWNPVDSELSDVSCDALSNVLIKILASLLLASIKNSSASFFIFIFKYLSALLVIIFFKSSWDN